MKYVSTAALFAKNFYKYSFKYFPRLYRTLETIFVEFPDFSRNFQTFPDYHENDNIFPDLHTQQKSCQSTTLHT